MEGARIVEEDLREELGASVRSVRQALADMAHEGLIVRKRHQGTFVSADLPVVSGAALPRIQKVGLLSGYRQEMLDRCDYISMFRSGMCSAMKSPAEIAFFVTPESGQPTAIDPPYVDPAVVRRSCQGLVAVEALNASLLNDLVRAGVQVLALDFSPPEHQFDVLTVDHVEAGYKATAHLRSLGHQRIAFLGEGADRGSSDPVWQQRLQGYQLAMADSGGPTPAQWICDVRRTAEYVDGNLPAFHRAHQPSAYVMASGSFFEPAQRVLKKLGCRIPDEVSIVSADVGVRESTYKALSTAWVDYEQVGRSAIRLLASRLACPSMPAIRMVVGPHFHARTSSRRLGP